MYILLTTVHYLLVANTTYPDLCASSVNGPVIQCPGRHLQFRDVERTGYAIGDADERLRALTYLLCAHDDDLRALEQCQREPFDKIVTLSSGLL